NKGSGKTLEKRSDEVWADLLDLAKRK
ncbi:MAG: hypothetical protein QG670_1939, partial [Thermoproteota archaeon]|nr:hypothetical protein [Thermoproteota archaeon]